MKSLLVGFGMILLACAILASFVGCVLLALDGHYLAAVPVAIPAVAFTLLTAFAMGEDLRGL